MASTEPTIRATNDSDGAAVGGLIAAIFAEYEGVLFVREELPELAQLATSFTEAGGASFVAERDGVIVGCVGYGNSKEAGGLELKKLYVRASERKSGLGARLVELVEAAASRRGVGFIELWSDTKFTTAHAFYEKRGYLRSAHTRRLHDASDTVEYHFKKSRP
ncbi:MAG: GNAT family N-acetyltransferase [Myxococcales bacterium]|nr:GNAT family N-acetyltransferase [Myxococcales bacterium]